MDLTDNNSNEEEMEIQDEIFHQLQIEETNQLRVTTSNTTYFSETNQIEHIPNISPVRATKITNNVENTNRN